MNKKGFTLVELLAVLVILSMITLIATPNIVSLMRQGTEKKFVEEVSKIVSNATYMYKNDNVREKSFSKSGDSYKILIKDINGDVSATDPFGYLYSDTSYISFTENLVSNNLYERVVNVYIESCKNNNVCHYICKENMNVSDSITRDDISDTLTSTCNNIKDL